MMKKYNVFFKVPRRERFLEKSIYSSYYKDFVVILHYNSIAFNVAIFELNLYEYFIFDVSHSCLTN